MCQCGSKSNQTMPTHWTRAGRGLSERKCAQSLGAADLANLVVTEVVIVRPNPRVPRHHCVSRSSGKDESSGFPRAGLGRARMGKARPHTPVRHEERSMSSKAAITVL